MVMPHGSMLKFLIMLIVCELCHSLNLENCDRPLGMESGRIPDSSLTSSSDFDQISTGASNARVRTETNGGAWCPKHQIDAQSKEWVQIDLGADTVIDAVETQGRYGDGFGVEYPPAYSLEYWRSTLGLWTRYRDRNGKEVLDGNRNTRTAVIRRLDGAVIASKVRFVPRSEFTRTVCMRIELYGCLYTGSLSTYSMPQGTVIDDLDFRDSSYDGRIDNAGILSDGIGQLFDGRIGGNDFDGPTHEWVGWRRDSIDNVPFDHPPDEFGSKMSTKIAASTVTYFRMDSMSGGYKWLVIGLTLTVLITSSLAMLALYFRYRLLRPSPLVVVAHKLFGGPKKMYESDGHRRSPGSYRMVVDNMENSFLEKLPHLDAKSVVTNDNNEYAEPDDCSSTGLNQLMPIVPLLTDASIHYASGDLIGRSDFSNKDNLNVPFEINADSGAPVEIPRESLHFHELLGEGEFGEVHLCRLERRLVAVKVLHTDGTDRSRMDFDLEMRHLSRLRHPNIVELVGICTDRQPWCCIVEFMSLGDLHQHLQRIDTACSEDTLISMATQVAAGMSYLESRHYIHRDLAARNCLIDHDGTVKIADFGMARSLYSADYYRLEGTFVLPIRWMAWECLLLGKFTSKSDVWAFGVVLWEMYTYCSSQPFQMLTDSQVIDNIQCIYHRGRLEIYLERPKSCPDDIFGIMMNCWSREQSKRSSFHDIHLFLQRKSWTFNKV